MFKIPKSPNLTELAYLSVKQHLLRGSFESNVRLTEESLATQLGISKSPVREALNRLESEGLISIEPRRGAWVRTFTPQEIQDLYNVREVLEIYAIGMARISPSLLQPMSDSIERMRGLLDEGDKLAHVEEDMRFHSLIASAAGNDELFRILENIQHKSLLCRIKTYDLSAVSAPASHYQILQSLRKGDRQQAQCEMRQHILHVRDSLLASLPEGKAP